MIKINDIELNENYLIAKQNKDIDYIDVFQLQTQTLKTALKPKDCMVAFFKSFSPFLTKLILAREAFAKTIGLKTAAKRDKASWEEHLNNFDGNIGDSIAIFDVLDKNDVELMSGQTDKHLDFKLSFICNKKNNQTIIELATTVKFHNNFGKAYFFFVKPFHRYYMKRILRKMHQHL